MAIDETNTYKDDGIDFVKLNNDWVKYILANPNTKARDFGWVLEHVSEPNDERRINR
jgi:hypothetical protein